MKTHKFYILLQFDEKKFNPGFFTIFSIDQQEIFAELVSIDDVPDYLDHIKKPMAFSTMHEKLEALEYKGIDEFEADFNVMVENCLSYNERETIFFRAGVKMRDQGGTIIRQAKREIENIGFDPDTGLHTSERLTPKEEFSGKKSKSDCLNNLLQSPTPGQKNLKSPGKKS